MRKFSYKKLGNINEHPNFLDIVRQMAALKDWIDSITDENILEEILAIKS